MRFLRYVMRAEGQRIFTTRLGAFTILMFLICQLYNAPLRNFSAEVNYPCAIWVFPFMLSQYTFLLIFFFAVIYANADIPFMQYSNMYAFIRTGRKKWGAAQLMILFFRSVVLVGITFAASVITLLPRVELTMQWGKLIKTIATNMAETASQYKYFFFYEALIEFTPLELLLKTCVITVLVVFLLSSILFLVSIYVNRMIAISGTTAYVLLMFYVINAHPRLRYAAAEYIPVLWPQVAKIYMPDMGFYWLPSEKEMAVRLIIAIAVICAVIMKKIMTAEFNWNHEDA